MAKLRRGPPPPVGPCGGQTGGRTRRTSGVPLVWSPFGDVGFFRLLLPAAPIRRPGPGFSRPRWAPGPPNVSPTRSDSPLGGGPRAKAPPPLTLVTGNTEKGPSSFGPCKGSAKGPLSRRAPLAPRSHPFLAPPLIRMLTLGRAKKYRLGPDRNPRPPPLPLFVPVSPSPVPPSDNDDSERPLT